jgi:glyoxylase-like metal-dependent hydrolase (beta-lactamase superfamily II)
MPLARHLSFVASLALCAATAGRAQTSGYSDSLLPAVRRAAALVPGPLPESVHVLAFNWGRRLLSSAVEGQADDSVTSSFVVFQIRYPHGWIMVDAGMDKQMANNPPRYSEPAYDRVQLALRDARMIVITHEHYDHIAGVLRSPYLDQIRPKTLLNRQQVQTLMAGGNPGGITLDSAAAARYIVVDYDLLLPIAPGVVLIKAPGHTPGSQMVYVRTAQGSEILLAGDVAWGLAGIETERQKPQTVSERLQENRAEIAPELAWLHHLYRQHVPVVVSHDDAELQTLLRQGTLVNDLDLKNP